MQDLYLPLLRRLSRQIDVRLCFDVDAGNSERVARALGAAAVTGGLEELLASPPTDGVVVALPNHLHAEAIVACVAAGRHVFCEKPVATHSAECDEIERATAASGRVVTVNLLRRFIPASVAMGELLRRGDLGRLEQIEVAEGGAGGDSRSGFQFVPEQSGGGVTLDRGAHVFDLLAHWLGTPVLSSYSDDSGGGCECTSFTGLRWPDGSRGLVKISKQEPWETRVVVEGERGSATWRLTEPAHVRVLSASESGEQIESTLAPAGKGRQFAFLDALAAILGLWVGACRGGNANPTPLSEARVAIDLITECYAARQPLAMDWLAFQD